MSKRPRKNVLNKVFVSVICLLASNIAGAAVAETSAVNASAVESSAVELMQETDDYTKFHPGHYLLTQISRRHSIEERERQRLVFIEKYRDEASLRGFVSHFEWKALETSKGKYNLDNIAEILKSLEGTDKYFGIYIRDRNFGANCTGAPVPNYLKAIEYGTPYKYKGRVCMIELYNPKVVSRKIALLRAIGERFDNHPNLEFVKDGESTVGASAGYSPGAWADQLMRYYSEVKEVLPHTMVLLQLNFLGTGSKLLHRVADHVAEVGGGAIGLPDVVPCRRLDIPDDEVCGYRIPGYEVLIAQQGKIAISPNVDTHDLYLSQTEEAFDMAVDYLGSNHVLWRRTFTSRRDPVAGVGINYVESEVLPVLRLNDSRINFECPESLEPCFMQ